MTDGYLTGIPGYWMLVPAAPIAAWIVLRYLHGEAEPAWTALALLALAHITAVVALTIFPIPISGQDYYRHTRAFSEDNPIPFATILSQLSQPSFNHFRQLFGNAVALAPLGIYGPGLWPALRDPRRFLLVAVAAGAGIELAQLGGSLLEGFTYRVTDVDDAMMNAAGAMAAFLVWRWLEPRISVWRPRPA